MTPSAKTGKRNWGRGLSELPWAFTFKTVPISKINAMAPGEKYNSFILYGF
jgi:hypothetical protein